MSRQNQPSELGEIIKGFVLLMFLHLLAGIIIILLGLVIGAIFGGYSVLGVWLVGGVGFLFWQLLYVIPLALRFQRQGKTGLMKGVIIGAVFTALINGACFLGMR